MVIGDKAFPLPSLTNDEPASRPSTPAQPSTLGQPSTPAQDSPPPVTDSEPTPSATPSSSAAETPPAGPETSPAGPAQTPASGDDTPSIVLSGDDAVHALKAELESRVAGEAQMRGQLADARSQLEGRAVAQERLEAAHAELRREFDGLRALISQEQERQAQERAQAKADLTTTVVTRDAALSEAAALRSELDRLGVELSDARRQAGMREATVSEAEELLAEARALSASMRKD